ncbi:alpha-glucan family phosphorylase [Ramlibacter sp. Leaf400]|uniref:alpha-glucan family phosphorylase n=1 Tax=Ramlibacter sp. Leaf400 TaxID=1736365 RepID=UPI0006FBEF0C|nr:alpha-glucan family phosphorylase [Ramlibacter sp. Leaf400]KQT08095.1 alpha-glucan phosphorylase [Ramlibacter sp. Leaf400]
MDNELLLPRVAYFSMEMALEPGMGTYSGGLGVLAGDHMRSAADLALPLVGVTMLSRQGYFRQSIEGDTQVEHDATWDPSKYAKRLPAKVRVTIRGREVWVGGWRHMVGSRCEDSKAVPVILLDTDLPENHPEDRKLTAFLYGGDETYRLCQEIVLGIGGVRLLAALGQQVQKYHLNEGHAALLTLELLRERLAAGETREEAIAGVQAHCVFTTHTPVPAGHDQFDYPLAAECLGPLVKDLGVQELAGKERLNMTHLALRLSNWVNGVAKRHAEVSRTMFPGYEVHAITNGIHPWTWASDAHRRLYDQHVQHWCHEPELLLHADRIPSAELLAAHREAKQALIALLQRSGGRRLEADRFTIGFARRMTDYKRPSLLFSDMARLQAIAKKYPIQIALAGKAHPRDELGKRHIARLHAFARELGDSIPIVFVPDYGIEAGRLLVGGVDLWLNTPQRPLEASGTSGMKAALNGVPNLSILDGWWLEGCEEGLTGWAIGEDGPHDDALDSKALYDKLEKTVLPLYYENPEGWMAVMRGAITRNGSFFHSHRMVRRYMLEAYTR